MALPGLKIASAGTPASAYQVLRRAIRDNNPVLFFEHRGLYNRKGWVDRELAPTANVAGAERLRGGSNITVVATLLMVDRAMAAATLLEAEGVDVEVIDLRWLRPLDIGAIARSASKTQRMLVVEEQVHNGGWGATLISHLTMQGLQWKAPPQALSLPDDLLIPYSPVLEDAVVPSVDGIAAAVRSVLKQ